MDPLTPNTSAFLSYLSSSLENTNNDIAAQQDTSNTFSPFDLTKTPGSFPPSAFFPMPGRDTPEDTPPSSKSDTQSPENNLTTTTHEISESDEEPAKNGGNKANHKRKAGQGQHKQVDEDEDEDDSETDDVTGHEDKRVHQNGKAPGGNKKGGRKSIGGEEGKGGKENKAARRKEQNRAAQKAFRERREAKVKDLEDKLAELEAKSYGTSVENENLRGILKRLQEENVALRQSAFTFSMPVNGTNQSGTGSNTPIASIQQQLSKPPTPPHSTHSVSDDNLRSIHDIQGGPSRKSSMLSGESPDSLRSVNSGSTSDVNGKYSPINLFNDPSTAFNYSALGHARPSLPTGNSASSSSTTRDGSSAPSAVSPTSATDRTELDALWASFLQQGAPQKQQVPAATGWNTNNDGSSAFPMYNANQGPATFAPEQAKVGSTSNNFDKFAFRDTSVPAAPQPAAPMPMQDQQADPWASMMDNSVDEFLASLVGNDTNPVDNEGGVSDADFNAQIAQILGSNNASPSDAFSLPGQNPFSPTNYLNMSPSPIVSGSVSNGPSPQTNSGSSVSASMSPESISGNEVTRVDSLGSGVSTFGPPKSESEHVYVVDEAGKVIKPSELWVRMGMQHESDLEHLLIDDLCDMMRSKATCKDGKKFLAAKDAETMFTFEGRDPAHDARMKTVAERAGVTGSVFIPQGNQ